MFILHIRLYSASIAMDGARRCARAHSSPRARGAMGISSSVYPATRTSTKGGCRQRLHAAAIPTRRKIITGAVGTAKAARKAGTTPLLLADASAPAFQLFGRAYLPWKSMGSETLAQVMAPPAPMLSTAKTTPTMANVTTTGEENECNSDNDGDHEGACARDSTNHGSHDLSHVSSVGHRSGDAMNGPHPWELSPGKGQGRGQLPG